MKKNVLRTSSLIFVLGLMGCALAPHKSAKAYGITVSCPSLNRVSNIKGERDITGVDNNDHVRWKAKLDVYPSNLKKPVASLNTIGFLTCDYGGLRGSISLSNGNIPLYQCKNVRDDVSSVVCQIKWD